MPISKRGSTLTADEPGPGPAVDVIRPVAQADAVLSLPVIATNLMQVGYNLADTFLVGRLGQAAVSALP